MSVPSKQNHYIHIDIQIDGQDEAHRLTHFAAK
jgi:hypothetical protein